MNLLTIILICIVIFIIVFGISLFFGWLIFGKKQVKEQEEFQQ